MPRRVFKGIVKSDACDKTVVVEVRSMVKHKLYHKFIQRSQKFMAHDEKNVCKVGDHVTIRECAPMSKRKTWEVLSS